MKLILERWQKFLEEEELKEATIRASRRYYYVKPENVTRDIWEKIMGVAYKQGVQTGAIPDDVPFPAWKDESGDEAGAGKLEMANRIFTEATSDANSTTWKFSLKLCLQPSTSQYGLRGDILRANTTQPPKLTQEMENAVDLGVYTHENVSVGTTKISWLQTKPEELRKESEHLLAIQNLFYDNGIGDEDEEGGRPATIIIKEHGGQGKSATLKNIVRIDKIASKTAVGDFGLYELGNDKPVFTMSHKAIGFERYAAVKSTLKELNKSKIEAGAAVGFLNTVARLWSDQILSGQRSTTGYHMKVDDPKFAEEVIYFIYGRGTRKAQSLFVGEISLTKIEEGAFELSVTPQTTKMGDSMALIADTLPDSEAYYPIFRTRYGGGGSKVALGDFGSDKETKKQNKIKYLDELQKKIDANEITFERLKELKVGYELAEMMLPGTDQPYYYLVDVTIPVRYYVSPMRRSDNSEEIDID